MYSNEVFTTDKENNEQRITTLEVIDERKIFDKDFRIWGTVENPLFLAKDIAEWIDYAKTGNGYYDVSNMLSTIDDDEKVLRKIFVDGKSKEYWLLTEDGLYEVLMQSRKPIAKKFKKKVKEILKDIRKYGIYATDNVIDNILNNPDFGIELLTKLKEERAARVKAEQRNAVLMHVNKTYTMTEIAKELGMKSATALNKLLSELHIQYKVNKTWVMYSDYSNLGYEEIKQEVLDNDVVVYHRRITQSGREFIINTVNEYRKVV